MPPHRVHNGDHGHSADASVWPCHYSHCKASRTAMRHLPRGYMRATRSVCVHRAVCMCLLGVRGTVWLLRSRLGHLERARVQAGLWLGRAGRSRRASALADLVELFAVLAGAARHIFWLASTGRRFQSCLQDYRGPDVAVKGRPEIVS
jgi:transposase